jgi:hypothetical protein
MVDRYAIGYECVANLLQSQGGKYHVSLMFSDFDRASTARAEALNSVVVIVAPVDLVFHESSNNGASQ